MDLRSKLERLKAAKTAKAPALKSSLQPEEPNPSNEPDSANKVDATNGTNGTDGTNRTEGTDKSSVRQRLIESLGGKVFRASELLGQGRAAKSSRPPDALELFPNAERADTPFGPTVRIVHRVALGGDTGAGSAASADAGARAAFGRYAFPFGGAFAELNGPDLAAIARDEALRPLNLSQLAFLDVETTGLAGGTGSYVFLVGIGHFDGGAFVIEQFFMEDYDREAAVMQAAAQTLAQFRALVTYNGKNFDVPLLRTRFLFNGVSHPLDDPNIDLLYPARRIWKQSLPDCSLATIEDRVLGIRARASDVPGALIPRIFFDYVRGARRERMIPVLDHNAQDIVSMASLLGLLGRLTRNPAHTPLDHPLELLGLARLIEWGARTAEAVECLERALLRAREEQLIFEISCRIARLYHRQGRFEEAAEIWASHVAKPQPHNLAAFVELAKHLEHRARDFARAAQTVERARAYCLSQSELLYDLGRHGEAEWLKRQLADLEKRRERLERKIARGVNP